jgi:hypothetical protein
MDHILVVGGSGVLRDVCRHFADEAYVVSVVARDKSRIVEMVAESQKAPGLINPITVDYTDITALQSKLIEAATLLGQPKLTLARINPKAFLARQSVAGFLTDHATGSRMFDLCCAEKGGTESAGLLSAHNFKIFYRKIILGSIFESDRARKLASDEICAGVIEAIEKDATEFIIGIV